METGTGPTDFRDIFPLRPSKGLLKLTLYVLRSGDPLKLIPLPVYWPEAPSPSVVIVTEVAGTGRVTGNPPGPKFANI